MPTIQDIADKLGVSTSTVSKGLNNASDISKDMKQAVLTAALELGYQHRKRKFHTKKIAILIEHMEYKNETQFGYEIITNFQLAAAAFPYEVIIMPIDSDIQNMQSYHKKMKKNGCTGAFFLGLSSHSAYFHQLLSTTIPTVLFDNYIANPYVASIETNHRQAFLQLIDMYYKKNHRSIAFVSGFHESAVTKERMKGFYDAMGVFQLPINPTLICTKEYTEELAHKLVPELIQNKATAIICGSDLIASAIITELRRLGKQIPGDISISGYDDLPIASLLSPPLTTIRQDQCAIGNTAFMLLHSLINHNYIDKVSMSPFLIERESTGINTHLEVEL